MPEKLVKFVRLSDVAKETLQVAISEQNGKEFDPPIIKTPIGLVVSQSDGKHILYFVEPDGSILDYAQRATLDEAIDEVSGVVGVEEWKDCDIDLGDEWESIPKEIFV